MSDNKSSLMTGGDRNYKVDFDVSVDVSFFIKSITSFKKRKTGTHQFMAPMNFIKKSKVKFWNHTRLALSHNEILVTFELEL